MSMEVHKIIEDFQKLREDFEVRKEQDIASNVTYVARRPAKGSTPLDNEFTSREGFQLSSIADEVEEVKHEQENKFQRKTRDLVELQRALERSTVRRLSLQKEVDNIAMDVSSTKVVVSETKLKCAALQEEIEQLLRSVTSKRNSYEYHNQHLQERQLRLYEKYKEKINFHQKICSELERGHVTSKLSGLTERVDALRKQRLDRLNDDISSVSSDNQITKMKSDLQEMQEELELSKNHNRDLECALAGSVGKTETTLQATAVLKKRNQAQLLRMRKHIQDAQSKERLWINEARRLENMIKQLETKSVN